MNRFTTCIFLFCICFQLQSQQIIQYVNKSKSDVSFNAIQKYFQNYIVVGNEGNNILLSELNLDGNIVSSKKITLIDEVVFPGVMTMLVDSENKIIIAGYRQNVGGSSKAFALKFDYYLGVVEWSIVLENEGSYFHHVIESIIDGHYLLCGQNITAGNNQEAVLFQVNKTTGAFANLTNINQGSNAETFYSITQNDTELILASRLTLNEGTSKMRACKTVINPAGTIISNQTYISDPTITSARLYAFHVQTIQDGIYMLIHGDESGTNTNKDLFVLKTNLNGDIQWLKKFDFTNYDFDGSWNSIRFDGDYLFLTGNLKDESLDEKGNIFIIKIDIDGNILWYNSYQFETNNVYNHQDFLIADANYLIGVGYIYDEEKSVYTGASILLKQTNGWLATDCFIEEPVEVLDLETESFAVTSSILENTFDFSFPLTTVSPSPTPLVTSYCTYTAVTDIANSININVYPNPTYDNISISSPSTLLQNFTLKIIDVNSHVIPVDRKHLIITEKKLVINLESYNLVNGIYQVVISNETDFGSANFVLAK